MINYELLDATLAAVEEEAAKDKDARTWQQKYWGVIWTEQRKNEFNLRCTSGGCFAGHAVLAAGGKLHASRNEQFEVEHYGFVHVENCIMPGGTKALISDAAASMLGISYQQRCALFDAQNGVVELRAMVAALHANPEADLRGMTGEYYDDIDEDDEDEDYVND